MKYTYNGKTYKSLTEFVNLNAHESVTDVCFKQRIKKGMSVEDALKTPASRGECRDHTGKLYESKKAMVYAYGIPYVTFEKRIARHWSLEQALTTPVNESMIRSRND